MTELNENESLLVLNQIISEIYIPSLANVGAEALKSDIQKFSSHILHTFQQVTGEIKLNIPNIVIKDAKIAAEDQKVRIIVT